MPSRLLNLPVFHSAELRHFSIFSTRRKVTCSLEGGVFCLVGANGLGKSTFLTSLSYALTGTVPEPGRKFESVREYHSDCLSFARRYFAGRIREKDRDTAEVEVEFSLGESRIRIVRGLFDPEDVRYLEVKTPNDHITHNDSTAEDRLTAYQAEVVRAAGVARFEQFAFLQHFVLTFDERRHLLFWDEKVLEQVLYLAFRVDPAEAEKADATRRAAEKADSLVRNLQWQATELQNRIEELEAAARGSSSDTRQDVELEFRALERQLEARQAEAERLTGELQSARIRASDLQSQQTRIREKYADEFRRQLRRAGPQKHPLVLESIADGTCGLCGSEGHISELARRIQRETCPLCGAQVSPPPTSGKGLSLKGLDKFEKEAADLRGTLADVLKQVGRLEQEDKSAIDALEKARRELDSFERKHKLSLARLNAPSDTLNTILQGYRRDINDLLERKQTQYEIRTQKRKEWKELQRPLEESYQDAEQTFVPIFRELAHSFLGLELDVSLHTRRNVPGATLVLEVRGTERKDEHQLSESQRFFLDIALRMALIQHIASDSKKACLFLDTPEGSLDLAYEGRAGDMLAKFVSAGFQVLMTANINTSQLVLHLAKRAKRERMHLERMTSWTELSDVQRKALPDFDSAYKALTEALDTGATRDA